MLQQTTNKKINVILGGGTFVCRGRRDQTNDEPGWKRPCYRSQQVHSRHKNKIKKIQTFWCVYLFVIPGQRPSRVRQGPVVVHIGGVSVEVLTPAAVGL